VKILNLQILLFWKIFISLSITLKYLQVLYQIYKLKKCKNIKPIKQHIKFQKLSLYFCKNIKVR
jgi:hypothetical protein